MDGRLTLRDGRTLVWHEWAVPDGIPLLRLQGTPGSRLSRYPRLDLWEQLGLRVIMADRPGYGGSTRLPGRGLREIADDLAQLLDHLELDAVPVAGGSGGGPHVLALCALHPQRVRAATVVAGMAPLDDTDLPLLLGLNAESMQRARTGGWSSLFELLAEQRLAILADPLAQLRLIERQAPPSDQAVMALPEFQRAFVDGVREALRPGAEGWTDEAFALMTDWDLAPEAVTLPIVWWHGRHDVNIPLQAVERLTARLPQCDLRVWDGRGHFEVYHREEEIVRELLARADVNWLGREA